MRTEIIHRRENGDRVKIQARFQFRYPAEAYYSVIITIAYPGKRLFENPIDVNISPFKDLSGQALKDAIHEAQLKLVTEEEIYEAKIAVWNKLKPTNH